LVATVPAESVAGRYREAITVLTDDPENNRINVEDNVLVKGDVFVSADELDLGSVSLRTLMSNPTAAPFLTQTIVINRRSGNKPSPSPADHPSVVGGRLSGNQRPGLRFKRQVVKVDQDGQPGKASLAGLFCAPDLQKGPTRGHLRSGDSSSSIGE